MDVHSGGACSTRGVSQQRQSEAWGTRVGWERAAWVVWTIHHDLLFVLDSFLLSFKVMSQGDRLAKSKPLARSWGGNSVSFFGIQFGSQGSTTWTRTERKAFRRLGVQNLSNVRHSSWQATKCNASSL